MATVGSVSVEVVPDARGFPEKLRAQLKSLGDLKVKIRPDDGFAKDFETRTSPGMRAAGDRFGREVSGRLSAALRNIPAAKITADSTSAQRSIDQIRRQLETVGKTFGVHVTDKAALAAIDHLKGKLDVLARESPDIRVKVDAKAALAEIAALQGELGLIPDEVKKSQKEFKPLQTSILALGPALIPITGAVLGLGAGVVGLGGTGVLAFKGIQREMKAGTATGLQYKLGINQLKSEFGGLSSVAAKATLPGFQAAVVTLHAAIPALSKDVGVLGSQLGQIGANTVTGLVNGFRTFSPLIKHAGEDVAVLSSKFAEWSSGPGGAKFADALGRSLDQALPALEDIAAAVGHVVAAFAPVGGTVLHIVDGLAKAINAIPVPVLEAIATTIVAINAAKLVSAPFDKFAVSLGKVGAEGAAASTGLGRFAASAAGVARFAGTAAAAGVAIYAVGTAISNYLERNNAAAKALDNASNAQSTFFNALTRSNGVINDGVKSTVSYQLEQDKLVGKAAKAGITQDQLTTAITGTDEQYNALIDTWKKSGKPSGDTLLAMTLLRQEFTKQQAAAKGATATQLGLSDAQAKAAKTAHLTAYEYLNASDALTKAKDKDKAADDLKKLEIATNFELMGTQDGLAKRYGITAAQVQSYADVLGVTQEKVQAGTVSAASYSHAVQLIANAYNNADQSGNAFLGALQAFSQSAGTAADRAALIGATLRAASGDALGYAGTLSSAAVAQKTFVDNIKTAASQAGKGGESTQAYLNSIVNLKTGVIDYNNAAAAPLITGLQSIQDAQIAAAQATYQHEVATKGGTVAGADAYNQYVARTGPQLVDQLTKLGLNSTAAQKLAREYLGVPADVKTKIQQEGADPVITILKRMETWLHGIADPAWLARINAQDNASGVIHRIRDALASLPRSVGVSVNASGQIGVAGGGRYAKGSGAGGVDDGWFTVGEGNPNTWELGHKQGSDVQIFSNAQSKEIAPGAQFGQMPGFAGGTVGGIQYTTDVAYHNAQVRAQQSAIAAQLRAATSTAKADKALVIRFDRTDLTRFEKAMKGGSAGILAAARTFNADLKSAGTGVAGLGGLESRLAGLANRRDAVNTRLTSARGTLSGLQQQSAQEQSTVSDRVLGEFNVASAGNGSIAGILANLTQNKDAAGKFAGNLGALKSVGLDPKLLAQLGEAGVSGGGVNASVLAGASKAQIAQINALFKQTGTFAGAAGKTVAGAEFGPAITAWTRQVNALTAQSHQLTKQIDHLGDVISTRVGHALDVALDKAVKKQAALALAARRAH
jgi:hypothetical protein